MENETEFEGIVGGEVGDNEGFFDAEDLGELVAGLRLCSYKGSNPSVDLRLLPTSQWAQM